jgi:hypothetical protein
MHDGPTSEPTSTIGQVVDQLQQRINALPPDQVLAVGANSYWRVECGFVDKAWRTDPSRRSRSISVAIAMPAVGFRRLSADLLPSFTRCG